MTTPIYSSPQTIYLSYAFNLIFPPPLIPYFYYSVLLLRPSLSPHRGYSYPHSICLPKLPTSSPHPPSSPSPPLFSYTPAHSITCPRPRCHILTPTLSHTPPTPSPPDTHSLTFHTSFGRLTTEDARGHLLPHAHSFPTTQLRFLLPNFPPTPHHSACLF
ncbi:hypothetical protein Pcinc_031427 [Petrolisthes cinctipes]|uniref:Uncharacterized protein n=1 Tax=Petrolisthes cinctipes TaxID=88211 RepID=A0AAE1EWN1_PETCI|nr:hypothetical protein Pcinc_031427 [Petrolisthes cinctipes]